MMLRRGLPRLGESSARRPASGMGRGMGALLRARLRGMRGVTGIRPVRLFARPWPRRSLKLLAFLALAVTGAWGIGFTWFARQAYQAAPLPERADGIVALTGGADRVATALRLLAEGRAPVLLISGVPPKELRGPGLDELAQRAGLDAAPLEGRVTLGRTASTTWGNAMETAEWAEQLGLRSLIVVTAGYHMPRALLELGRVLPGVALHPVPVVPPALRGSGTRGTLALLVGEYNKLLGAELGLARLRGAGA